MDAPDVLAFDDRRTDGAYRVTEPSGEVVALVRVAFWSGSRFEATTGTGEPLCSGRRPALLSTRWEALGPTGTPLLSMRSGFWGTTRTVTLTDGRELRLEGKVFGRDWALRDGAGRDVLTSTPTTGAWTFHPDAWVVSCHDATLGLAQVVAVVQLHRLMVKAGRAAAAS